MHLNKLMLRSQLAHADLSPGLGIVMSAMRGQGSSSATAFNCSISRLCMSCQPKLVDCCLHLCSPSVEWPVRLRAPCGPLQAVLKQTHLEPSVAGASAASRTSQWMEIIRHVQASSGSGTTARVGALWTGVGATLARDVPFSALYWALLEPVRDLLLPGQQASAGGDAQQSAPAAGPAYRPHTYRTPAGQAAAPLAAIIHHSAASPSSNDVSTADETHPGVEEPADRNASASGHPHTQWSARPDHLHPHGPADPAGQVSGAQSEPAPQWASQAGDDQEEAAQWRGFQSGSMQASPHGHVKQEAAGQPHQRQHRAAAGSGQEDMKAAGLKDRGEAEVGPVNSQAPSSWHHSA